MNMTHPHSIILSAKIALYGISTGLEPVALVTNRGFRVHEIRRITRLVVQHQATLLEAWHDYFGT
jgi:hypothetical protein